MQILQLIEKCKQKDKKAQYQLYEWGFPILMKVAYKYKPNRDDAKSLVNLAFFKIFTQIDTFDTQNNFEFWCKKILIHTIIDEYRKERKHYEHTKEINDSDDLENNIFYSEDEWNTIEKLFNESPLEDVLTSIDEKYRVVLLLHEIEGYSHEEIAEKLAISKRTSIRYLKKAKEQLLSIAKKKVVPTACYE